MKRLLTVLLCITLAVAPVACGQDKGKTTQAQSKSTQAQKKAPAKSQKKAPTVAQRKQQDRMGECNKQANLKNMKGEDRKKFMNTCLGGRA